MRHRVALLVVSIGIAVWSGAVSADDDSQADPLYYIAMRVPQVDPAPRYVSAAQTATADQTSAFSGCDGQTYYLTPSDATAVSAAIANNATVQLQVAPQGTAVEDSSVLCLVQASP